MKINDIAKELILIPHFFSSLGNVSVYDLLKKTGYFEKYEQISVGEIRAALVQHPECIDTWLNYSEDKRSISGWYITREYDGNYIVGYFSKVKEKETKIKYTDRIDACAIFIKHEVEEMRLHNNGE